jgi:hypothetical protein
MWQFRERSPGRMRLAHVVFMDLSSPPHLVVSPAESLLDCAPISKFVCTPTYSIRLPMIGSSLCFRRVAFCLDGAEHSPVSPYLVLNDTLTDTRLAELVPSAWAATLRHCTLVLITCAILV